MNQFQAAQEGSLQWFQENTYDINAINIYGTTVLAKACHANQSKVASYLIKAGADVNLGTVTPLMYAASEKHHGIVDLLLTANAQVNKKDATGATALTYALTDDCDIDEEEDIIKVVSALISAGANVSVTGPDTDTPLMMAIYNIKTPIVSTMLVEAGANPNEKTSYGSSILHASIHIDNTAFCKLLVSKGASCDYTYNGDTPLIYACAQGMYELCAHMLSEHPNDDIVNIENNQGETPLSIAASRKDIDMCVLLISAGANMEVRDKHGHTPLMHAVEYGHEAVCKVLLEHGANPHAEYSDGHDLIGFALQSRRMDICRLLVSRGAIPHPDCASAVPDINAFYCAPRTLKYSILGLRVTKKLGNMQLRKWNTYEREVAVF